MPHDQDRAAACRAAVRGDAVTLGDLARRIMMLEVVCRWLDTATERVSEALMQVLTVQRPALRRW